MKIPRIIHATEHIEDRLISEAADTSPEAAGTSEEIANTSGEAANTSGEAASSFGEFAVFGPSSANPPLRPGLVALAASLLVLVAVATILLPMSLNRRKAAGRYKEFSYTLSEIAYEWPWEYLTPAERYTTLDLDGTEYQNRGSEISAALVGEALGEYSISGYDSYTDTEHEVDCTVYEILHVDPSQAVAVELEGTRYVFRTSVYAPCQTLGELFSVADLPQIIELSRFSEGGDGPDRQHFVLQDDAPIWAVLKECAGAPFIDDQSWFVQDRSYLSFTVTSEALGIYKKALYITEDGYLWTNAFEWMYLYDIGEDAAGEIIRYAKEHSEKADYEPYETVVIGQITEIAEDYILVDDTALCRDPKDGLTYRIATDDIRIARCLLYGNYQVGDWIYVPYRGEIDTEHGNTIRGALYLEKAYLTGDGVEVLE